MWFETIRGGRGREKLTREGRILSNIGIMRDMLELSAILDSGEALGVKQ